MALKCDASNVKNENDLGGSKPAPGRYHAVVDMVDETFDKFDKVIVRFEILAGRQFDKPEDNPAAQKGKKITEYYATTDNAMSRLVRLAMATGLLQPGESKDVVFSDADRRQLIIEVEEHKYTPKDSTEEKTGIRLSYMGMWNLDNPEVADVPRNEAAIKLWKSGQTANQAASQAQQQQTDGGGEQGWGGLIGP